jgi:predicted aldo/keto reductase-like oxidoreductase
MKNFRPFTNAEYAVIEKARAAFDAIENVPCTGCNYCTKDCPQSVAIPTVFDALNYYLVFGNLDYAKGHYRNWAASSAGKCIECGQCEAACPQHISIMQELKRAVAALE